MTLGEARKVAESVEGTAVSFGIMEDIVDNLQRAFPVFDWWLDGARIRVRMKE